MHQWVYSWTGLTENKNHKKYYTMGLRKGPQPVLSTYHTDNKRQLSGRDIPKPDSLVFRKSDHDCP